MTKKQPNTPSGDRQRDRAARHRQPRRKALDGNRIRVRAKTLDQVDEEKLTLAFWLLAKQIVADETDQAELSEADVRKVAEQLDESDVPGRSRTDGGAS